MIETMTGTEPYLSEFERFAATRGNGSQDWLMPIRRQAIRRFAELGFPTTRDEEWRYTNVSPIANTAFELPGDDRPSVSPADVEPFRFDEAGCSLLVFVDGRYTPDLSSLKAMPKGVRVGSLAEAIRADRSLLEGHLTRHADYHDQAFAALNTAFMNDGAFVYVSSGIVVEAPIHLIFLSTANGRATMIHPRNLIVAESSSRVTVVETYAGLGEGLYFTNALTEMVVGENAVVEHYKVERESDRAYHISTRQAHQSRHSNLSSHTMTFGGQLVRNDINTMLDGEGANCMFNGLYVLNGSQHVDNHLRVDHAKPHCNSWEYFKGILDDRSRGVFTGRIIVREHAQKTDAKQSNMNLLLSRDATVDTKPQLEILADDVKCTHGATIGQIDENAIFYLRTRGISEPAARSILIHAFAGESIGQIRLAALRDQLQDCLSTRLPQGQALRLGRPYEYDDDFGRLVRAADRRRET